MNKKLDTKHELNKIKQTRNKTVEASAPASASPALRNKRSTIPFRDSAIDKITTSNTEFGSKVYRPFNFDMPKGSSMKGLMLKFYKKTQKKSFVLSLWFNKRNEYCTHQYDRTPYQIYKIYFQSHILDKLQIRF